MAQKLPAMASLVRDNCELLLARWRERVRQLDSAEHLDVPTLNDHVPVLIQDIAEAFDRFGSVPSASGDRTAASPNVRASEVVQGAAESADIHGAERLNAGFDLEEVVAEYGIFRDVLIELLDENQITISPVRLGAINSVIDVAIARAVQTYSSQRAEQLRRAHQQHLRFVTHDLRSPLQAISLAVARLEIQNRLGEQDPAMVRLAGTLQRSSDRLLELVDEIMSTDRADINESASPRDVELWVIVERLLDGLAPLAERNCSQLHNQVPDDVVVRFDPMMLERVLQNLVSNAIAAAPNGSIVIGASNDTPGRWSTTVSNMPGTLSEAQIEALTNPDIPSQSSSYPKGNGIRIVRELCTANDVSIAVAQSAEDGVSITLSGSR